MIILFSLHFFMQKGNPLLKHIRNVKWAFADVVCDYLLGQSSCALYLRLDILWFRKHGSVCAKFVLSAYGTDFLSHLVRC